MKLAIQNQRTIALRDYAYFVEMEMVVSMVGYLELRIGLMQNLCFLTGYASFLKEGDLEMPSCSVGYFDLNQTQQNHYLMDRSYSSAGTTLPAFASSAVDAVLFHVLSSAVLSSSFPQSAGHRVYNS